MKKSIIFAILLLTISCNFFKSKEETKIPDDWEMIEMFGDEITELNEGGYCPFFYNRDNPEKDSLFEDSDNRIVAIIVNSTNETGTSKAKIWVADSEQDLILKTNDAKDKNGYTRVYENDLFTVTMTMKIFERIDGLDDEDMIVYSGKMKVQRNGTDQFKEYKVKGGC